MTSKSRDSFGARATLKVGPRRYQIYRIDAIKDHGDIPRLPYSIKILLENLLRREDGVSVTREDIVALAQWSPSQHSPREIAFCPARILLQDFTGVPALVDLAAMRDAMADLGGDPKRINPRLPVELVVDHSIQVDEYGTAGAYARNVELEYQRNAERYAFLKWGQRAFANFKVVPPGGGICHQVNLEHLARVVFAAEDGLAYPDTCLGTDSHTPMVNGLSVLAWGVGGIEAEAALLGQPISMLIPEVIGFKLEGELPEGATATDLVLTITEMLRAKGVVGKFVEFYGPGLASLALADRATISNMSPEFGATCAIFPPDEVTLQYLRFTGRAEEQIALVEAYMKEQGLFHQKDSPDPIFSDTLYLNLHEVEPCIAGPSRPQDRIPLSRAKTEGTVVIAAITSCTNTSNPSVMIAAGLLAKKAVEKGLRQKPWVKTSLAPGSKAVTSYLEKAGLTPYLEQLGFFLAGYGCTTCIGNSGPLPQEFAEQIHRDDLLAVAVLSGNRNFEGRIHPDVRANYLMSPPLVVAYAIAGRMDWNPINEPVAEAGDGSAVFLKDIWPTRNEVDAAVQAAVRSEMYEKTYATIFDGDESWQRLDAPAGDRFLWDLTSTYVRRPPYFDGMTAAAPQGIEDIHGARAIAFLGDSITTDHISPAGSIKVKSPAGEYLIVQGIEPKDFNSYGARRGNHEVMVRGTFANVRIRNRLAPGTEGGFTTYFPEDEVTTIYDAAMKYKNDGTPLCVIAGSEYGSGSSRDWAAKGPYLQGVRFVLAESFERIHRSNLVGMGIVPLQFRDGENADTLGLTGREVFDVMGLRVALDTRFTAGREVAVRATGEDGTVKTFTAIIRVDTPQEALYMLNGGILPYVLRQLVEQRPEEVKPLAGGIATTAQPRVDAAPADEAVDEGSLRSFPASDPPAY